MRLGARAWTVPLLLAAGFAPAGISQGAAQQAAAQTGPVLGQAGGQAPVPAAGGATQTAKPVVVAGPVQASSQRDQRKAAKLYLEGTKILAKGKPEAAWALLKQAAELEPESSTFLRAAELARQSAVTQLMQQASQKNLAGQTIDAVALLQRALAIDPKNPQAVERLREWATAKSGTKVDVSAAEAVRREQPGALSPQDSEDLSSHGLETLSDGGIRLEPLATKQSFHMRNGAKQVILDVFKAYGIQATLHDSVTNRQTRLDLDDASFAQAVHVLGLTTNTFAEPLDPHRVVVALDTRENRTQFRRTVLETVFLPGLTDTELNDMTNLGRNLFEAQQAVVSPTAGTVTLRATPQTLEAFNRTIALLEAGKNQLQMDIKVIELSHDNQRDTGATFFQQTTVANDYSEIQQILQQNQSAVQQIIASGVVPNDTTFNNQLAIIGILLASGQLTSTIFNQGFLLFGNGITASALSPGPAMLNFSLNSSDTRVLDDVHLQLGDGEPGTFKTGERYPIETSSYSALALTTLAGATGSTSQAVPQIQYEDLGLTFKATPKVMRGGDVALTLELKIESLGGTALNDIPILNSQQVSGVITVKQGETAVLVSDLSRQQSRALSGLPGISDIPGLQDVSDISRDVSTSRLLILVTPTVVRETQQVAHGPMILVDKSVTGR
jgi:type II secretory pathway component GspD/PulD (secretin)